jgi:hypothetical protein
MAQAPAKQAPQQGPPPKNLSVRADGHLSANGDPKDADKFQVHVVKQGETLSGIAGEVLKNPRMWPQLWEQNEHIINPHWIYPNDKILVAPVTPLAEAKPPEPEAPAAPPAPPAPPAPEQPQAPRRIQLPAVAPPPPAPASRTGVLVIDQRAPGPEIKFEDIYCSGFVRTERVEKKYKVIGRYDPSGAVLAAQTDYVYLSRGAEDGIAIGGDYQVVRPTKSLTNPYGHTHGDRNLGMHYLDVAQVRVVLAQADYSLARVIHSCGDAVEVGDLVIPFQPVVFPQPPRPRPFSPTMTTNSGIDGMIVASKSVLENFGSAFHSSGVIPGVRGDDRLGVTERGIAGAGEIVYIDVGSDTGVKLGDLFIVYRYEDYDSQLFPAPREIKRLKDARSAVGELIIVNVGERASTAVVTYASDALSLGDAVERR